MVNLFQPGSKQTLFADYLFLAGFLLLVEFENITNLEIIEILEVNAALKTGQDFLHIVLESSQTGHSGINNNLTLS
jgi:hypothetical protein